MDKRLEKIIIKIGGDKAKTVFLDYCKQNEPEIRKFVEKKIEAEKSGNIMENIGLSLMPMDMKVAIYLGNVMKDTKACKVLMDEFLAEYSDDAFAFASAHPLVTNAL